MRHLKRVSASPDALETFELRLKEDGTFIWLITRSEPPSHDARGRWKQTGDTIVFEVEHASDGAPVPTTALVVGDRLDLAGFGILG